MAAAILTQERLKELLEYDPETGLFTWQPGRIRAGKPAGSILSLGYVSIRIHGKSYYGHRLAWLYMTGSFPADQIDHINGERSDNSYTNLRQVTRSENKQNLRGPKSHNKSGFLGVFFDTHAGIYKAFISVSGKKKYLGSFNDPELAAHVYLQAKRELHPFNTI